MKKFKLLLALSFILTTILFFGCKKDKVEESNQASDSSWTFGSYAYVKGASSQSLSSTGSFVAIAVSTAGNGGNYGAYSGSGLTFSMYSNLGEGDYTFADLNTVVANPGSRFIYADCTIGTAVNTGSILYSIMGPTTIKAKVTIDANGKYHIKAPNSVVLSKKIVVGNGIPGAAETYPLTLNNVY